MSDTASRLLGRRLDIAWGVFAGVNLYAMTLAPHAPTIPFHVIWISLTLVYGIRIWPLGATLVVLAVICLATGAVLGDLVARGDIDWEEITEVPLMAVVFLAMVWHARRRRTAQVDLEQAVASERAMRRHQQLFARQASHQLRSPLSLARGHVQFVHRALAPGAESADLEVAMEQMDRVAAVTQRLLTLGSLEEAETLQRSPTRVDGLVQAAVARWARTHPRGWSCAVRGEITASIDPQRFEAALDELLDNAVAHTEDNDSIEVAVDVTGRDLRVTVADSGPGVHAEHVDRVFDTFWRSPRSPYRGSGLGLSIVKAVAAVHGGTATVTSTAQGASFVMTFPGAVLAAPAPAWAR